MEGQLRLAAGHRPVRDDVDGVHGPVGERDAERRLAVGPREARDDLLRRPVRAGHDDGDCVVGLAAGGVPRHERVACPVVGERERLGRGKPAPREEHLRRVERAGVGAGHGVRAHDADVRADELVERRRRVPARPLEPAPVRADERVHQGRAGPGELGEQVALGRLRGGLGVGGRDAGADHVLPAPLGHDDGADGVSAAAEDASVEDGHGS